MRAVQPEKTKGAPAGAPNVDDFLFKSDGEV
jgi:hypothetical protein